MFYQRKNPTSLTKSDFILFNNGGCIEWKLYKYYTVFINYDSSIKLKYQHKYQQILSILYRPIFTEEAPFILQSTIPQNPRTGTPQRRRAPTLPCTKAAVRRRGKPPPAVRPPARPLAAACAAERQPGKGRCREPYSVSSLSARGSTPPPCQKGPNPSSVFCAGAANPTKKGGIRSPLMGFGALSRKA